VVQLFELTNQQPFDDLEIEEQHTTPEQLRQSEQMLFACGHQRWTYYLVEKATSQFTGYTETVWNPNRPQVLSQGMTGIFPKYRNRGLGRWLKTAILKINNELGFKPYMASTFWQVEIERDLEYLGETR
jgi:mycothiol synthase